MTTHSETSPSSKKDGKQNNGASGGAAGGALNDLKEAALDDPIFSFLSRWSNVITVVCIIAGLVFLYMQQSEKAFQQAMQESARVLREGRLTFNQYQTLVERRRELQEKIDGTYIAAEGETVPGMAELETELKKVDETIASVETTLTGKFNVLAQSRGGYGAMGQAYQVLLQLRKGELDQALATLKTLAWQSQATDSSERMYYELAALSVARALLDTPDRQAEGVERLRILATEGSVANVSAGLVLATIASSDEERIAARELLEAIIARNPEQSELLEREIQSLQ